MSQHLPAVRTEGRPPRPPVSWCLIHHSTGSQHILKHPGKPGLRVTVAVHSKDLKRRTLASIIEQAGYTVEEFLELL